MVRLTSRARIYIERYTKTLKRIFDDLVVTVHYLLGGNTLFACTNGDRNTMLIATTHKKHIFAFQTEIANINISWNIYTRKVSNMHGTIGIWKSRSYKSSLKCHTKFTI